MSPAGSFPLHRDGLALPWLVSVRWTGVLALGGAVAAGVRGFGGPDSLSVPILIVLSAASNAWLSIRLSRGRLLPLRAAGLITAADVLVLSWVLHETGGVLNPASIFYLVYIVLAALALGRSWAWSIALLSIAGYGLLFLFPPEGLATAGAMHPEIGLHVRGMWLAFAAVALLIALLVGRLVELVERRDRDLSELRERSARDARLAAMSTLAAGAAHELNTPLGTIAVAARELELELERLAADGELLSDVRLIRSEVDRCRRLLQDMSARISEPQGEAVAPLTLATLADRLVRELTPTERRRIRLAMPDTVEVVWPAGVVVRTLVNVVRNGLQASAPDGLVTVTADPDDRDILVRIVDTGRGMSPDELARAGEPFFTTKAPGEGTGLGLFVARSSVEQLRGSLTIESREGAGTTVTIRLPVDVAAPLSPS